jgi:endonuclease YncB( thermonuclease family)
MKFLEHIVQSVLTLTVFIPSFFGQPQTEITGKVVKVIDGNTLEILQDDKQKVKVLLIGIDSPELQQAYGEKAKQFLERLVLNRKVTATTHGKDRWGNRLAEVLVNGDDDPRVELLKAGLAWTAEKNPNPDLEPYRTWAQQKGKGLWQDTNPTPPWTFRRQQTMVNPKSS